MNIHTSNSVSIVSIKLRSTLATITQDVTGLPDKLAGDLISAGLMPTGPMMFLYDNVIDDPHHEFGLRIALPLSESDAAKYKGVYEASRLESFRFVETVLHGDLAELGPKAYEPLFADIHAAGLTVTRFAREVYQNYVDPSSADNETRIQVEVVA